MIQVHYDHKFIAGKLTEIVFDDEVVGLNHSSDNYVRIRKKCRFLLQQLKLRLLWIEPEKYKLTLTGNNLSDNCSSDNY